MTTNTSLTLDVDRPLGGVPFGNVSILPFEAAFEDGVWVLSDDATATVHTDKLILGTIPKGTKMLDALIKQTAILGDTNSTIDVGFEYVDGVDVAADPETINYFVDAKAIDALITAHTVRFNATVPITLTKDAYLIVTVNTAAFVTNLDGSLLIDIMCICDQ